MRVVITAGAAILDYRDDWAFPSPLVALLLILLLPLSLKPCFYTNSPASCISLSSSLFICWDPLSLMEVAYMNMGWELFLEQGCFLLNDHTTKGNVALFQQPLAARASQEGVKEASCAPAHPR